jgi:hypothetical protein
MCPYSTKGTFISYDNCVYLGGACNVGKSTLASILIGEEIPKEWISTDGLNIFAKYLLIVWMFYLASVSKEPSL